MEHGPDLGLGIQYKGEESWKVGTEQEQEQEQELTTRGSLVSLVPVSAADVATKTTSSSPKALTASCGRCYRRQQPNTTGWVSQREGEKERGIERDREREKVQNYKRHLEAQGL